MIFKKCALYVLLSLIFVPYAVAWERNVVKRFDNKVELNVMRIMPSGVSHEPWLHCTIYKGRHICTPKKNKQATIIMIDNYWQNTN